jgi:Uma2 family endonuclease
MAALPDAPVIPVDEYLNSSYRPDLEYVDGLLVERGVPTILHSLLQMLLIQYLSQYQKALRFLPLPEARTRIIERARYRIPDILLCALPLPTGKIVTSIPLAVIEILSPTDRMPDQLDRFRDYMRLGVQHVVLLDPVERLAFRFENGSLLQTQFTALDLPAGPLPFDTHALFLQLDELKAQGLE